MLSLGLEGGDVHFTSIPSRDRPARMREGDWKFIGRFTFFTKPVFSPYYLLSAHMASTSIHSLRTTYLQY